MTEKAWLNKFLPTWAWFVFGALAIYLASLAGKALHPNARQSQNRPSLATTAYLCNLQSYRQEMIQDAIEEADNHGGDKFDEDAARKRVLAIPNATLDLQRLSDLAFTRKTNRDAGDMREICPGQ